MSNCCYCQKSETNKSETDNPERKKQTIAFYKHVFLNLICALEFLLMHYPQFNLFNLNINDFSKSFAADIDNYVPILDALYEKYKTTTKPISPETQLILQLVCQIVTYHLTKTLFGNPDPSMNKSFINSLIKNFEKKIEK